MTFQKGRHAQENYAGLEVVADNYALADGTQVSSATKGAAIAALAAVATADATDLTTSEALANALKVKVNAIIAALQA